MIQIVGKTTCIFNRSFSFHHKSELQQLSYGIHCEIKFATWQWSLMSNIQSFLKGPGGFYCFEA